VFGSGTVLDSARLRTLLAQHCDVAVHSVNAFIVGEHGDSQVPAWSQAAIGGVPVRDWAPAGRAPLDEQTLDRIAHEVVTAAEQIIRGKGATNFAVGLSAAGIVEAVLNDERSVMPVSSLLAGEYAIDDVCLSLPSIVDSKGVDLVLTPPLSDDESDALRRSADTVRGVERSLGV
jgi:L-lactate dehydrogenase